MGEAPIASAPLSRSAFLAVCSKIGLLSFGGGLTGWVHREVVLLRGWMGESEFMSAVTLSQILPGTNVSNLLVLIGQRLFGMGGAAIALFGLLWGPFLAVIGLLSLYGAISGLAWIGRGMDGVAAAAVGMLMLVGLRGARRVSAQPLSLMALLATFLCVGVLQWPLVPVVLVVAPLSIGLAWARRPRGAG